MGAWDRKAQEVLEGAQGGRPDAGSAVQRNAASSGWGVLRHIAADRTRPWRGVWVPGGPKAEAPPSGSSLRDRSAAEVLAQERFEAIEVGVDGGNAYGSAQGSYSEFSAEACLEPGKRELPTWGLDQAIQHSAGRELEGLFSGPRIAEATAPERDAGFTGGPLDVSVGDWLALGIQEVEGDGASSPIEPVRPVQAHAG